MNFTDLRIWIEVLISIVIVLLLARIFRIDLELFGIFLSSVILFTAIEFTIGRKFR